MENHLAGETEWDLPQRKYLNARFGYPVAHVLRLLEVKDFTGHARN